MKKYLSSFIISLLCLTFAYAQTPFEWNGAVYNGIAEKYRYLGFYADFKGTEMDSAWKCTIKPEFFTAKIENDILKVHSKENERFVFYRNFQIDTDKDFEINLEVKSTMNISGLVWGKKNDLQYEFVFNPSKQVIIRSTANGFSQDTYRTPQVSDAVLSEEFNTLTLRKLDKIYYFFVNGTLVHQMPWKAFFDKSLGFIVSPHSDIEVKNISAYSLSRSSDKTTYAMKVLENANVSTENRSIDDKKAPAIEILSPQVMRDRALSIVEAKLKVIGIATDINGVFEVKVNQIPAKLQPDGHFELEIPLTIGMNSIKVEATDMFHNTENYEFFMDRKPSTMPTNKGVGVVASPENVKALAMGNYHVLLIAVQDYNDASINDLQNPISDAQQLYETLTSSYTIDKQNVTFLKNPKRTDITKELDRLLDIVQPEDNVLIFYAGHGYWDERLKQGYWFPADAQRDNRGTWFTNGDMKDYIKGINSRHTLLITDACFSGSIFRGEANVMQTSVEEVVKLPSRRAMTSGAMKVVPDKSVFIEYLIKRLSENKEKYLPSEVLFHSFKTAVINNSANGQVPQFGVINESGDEGGDFIFIKK